MTDIFTTCQLIANWLESNKVNAPPLAIIALTNIILESISQAREDAYELGYQDARKENDECKQP